MMVQHSAEADEFYKRFFSGSGDKRYLYGINEYSESIARVIKIDGFIDDYTEKKIWLDTPVLKFSGIGRDSMVVACTTSNYTHSVINKIRAAGISSYIDYISLADASHGALSQVKAIADTRADHEAHAKEYAWLRKRLFDDRSRAEFDRLMDFRLAGNIRAMECFEYAAERQYFEPFAPLDKGEVFIDGGGFDGFTALTFAARCPEYAAIHFFEPAPAVMAVAKEKLKALGRVYYHQAGLFDRPATINFDASAGSASRISGSGSEQIEVVRLDDAVEEAVSFIKLDLEGAELVALQGMERHICNDHPQLAVAVYHHPSDFWRIPQFILGLRDDYNIYLRHYTEGWAETVMFFIPR